MFPSKSIEDIALSDTFGGFMTNLRNHLTAIVSSDTSVNCKVCLCIRALDSLVHVGAADIGIPRVLFCAQELIVKSSSGDNEFGQASR